ncbi:MAG TPA: glycosyltransferase family 2 protein [Actinomyces sp.]|nr:glycosyltransferase family 2 protein [Acidobacteriota bacterium]HHT40048.1 glycosyltransferase family 2 protein [Actinomyces sp.]
MAIKKISLIVPCYNEGATLPELVQQVSKNLDPLDVDWKLILINDGSKDNTGEVIERLATENESVQGILFSRNFGKESAMLAGLKYATGDAAIIMDADLQHPPEILPKLIQTMDETGADQVVARRNRKGDSWLRSTLSRFYYWFSNKMVEDIELVDGSGDFRILSWRAVDTLLALDERSRFSKGLFSWIGYPTVYIEYENRQRVHGESAWSFRSLFNYGLDGVISFNAKPLRVVAGFGAVIFGLSLIYFLWLIINWAFYGVETPGYITTIAAIIAFSGIQLLALGVIGEYVGRIYSEVKQRPHYVVWKEVGF